MPLAHRRGVITRRPFATYSWGAVLLVAYAGVSLAAQASPAGGRRERGVELKGRDALKHGQTINTNPPPLSPAQRNVDGGAAPVGPRREIPSEPIFSRRRFVNTNSPPRTASEFNPDPGGKRSQPVPAEPFFTNEPAPPPAYEGDPIDGKLRLPRWPLVEETLVPRRPRRTEDGDYERGPLPPQQALPRRDVRQNEKLHFEAHENPRYPLAERGEGIPPFASAQPDRFQVGFGFAPWKRYTTGLSEQPFERPTPYLWHPYQQSKLKGDLPVWGQDKFLNLTATSDTIAEFRRVPTPSGVSSARTDSAEFFGRSEQVGVQQYLGFSAELFSGEAALKPPHWTIKVVPVLNVNHAQVQETGILAPDPRGIDGGDNSPPPDNSGVVNPGDVNDLLNGQLDPAGGSHSRTRYTERTRTFWALQEYFVEYHVADLTENYDFVAVKAGNQAFNHDFRGFLFNDVNLGGRLFGNWDNNHWQYNLLGFDLREKDTFSGLNSFDSRDQRVFLANVYRQDLFWKGYTGQLSLAANLDEGGTHYDRTGAIVRPQPLGTVRPHDVRAYYVGWAGEGHMGRLNISHQFYQAFGRDEFNQLAGRPVDIQAQMGALELSYDRDWLRYKASFFYASGDQNADDGTGGGFDTILDNPNFTGGPFSYYVRQGFNLGGTGVGFKQPNSLVPSLRTSKTQGQASFVNPGILIHGVGLDADVTPRLRSFFNVNYLRFAETDSLRTVVLQDNIRSELGWDLSVGVQWRPFLTDNIILSAGFGVLIPGSGYRDLYRRNTDPVPGFDDLESERAGRPDAFLYSGVLALNLTY